jgi:hypothetical protein
MPRLPQQPPSSSRAGASRSCKALSSRRLVSCYLDASASLLAMARLFSGLVRGMLYYSVYYSRSAKWAGAFGSEWRRLCRGSDVEESQQPEVQVGCGSIAPLALPVYAVASLHLPVLVLVPPNLLPVGCRRCLPLSHHFERSVASVSAACSRLHLPVKLMVTVRVLYDLGLPHPLFSFFGRTHNGACGYVWESGADWSTGHWYVMITFNSQAHRSSTCTVVVQYSLRGPCSVQGMYCTV